MKQFTMKNPTMPLNDSYDVIVIGGGPAGCAAAIASAREGVKTLLIEATGCLGGMGTSGLIPAWCPFSNKKEIVYRGIAQKIFDASRKPLKHVPDTWVDWVPIDAEVLKRVYDEEVSASGADILFNTFVSAVEGDSNGTLNTIITSNKSGLSAYTAKMFIDCSGDADVAVWAGAKYEKNEDLQPATHCFTVSNVDQYNYSNGERLHPNNSNSPIYSIVASGNYPLIKDTHMCNTNIDSSIVGFNAGHLWDVDGTDPKSVSKAMIEGRKLADQIVSALRENVPASFGSAHLAQTASLMGIRETRRIVGEYVFTADDYIARKSFPDEIGRNCYYLDVHHKKEEISEINKGSELLESRAHRYAPGESHGIPFRCLIPKGLKNVLIAGRSISSDRASNGSLRVMPPCLVTGEAAGCAAGMAVNNAYTDIRELNVDSLRDKLRSYGAYFE